MKEYLLIGLLCIASCGYPDQYRSPGGPETDIGIAGIDIYLPSTVITAGGNLQARLLILLTNGEKIPRAETDASWASADTAVASIDESGLITALAGGESDISATLGGYSAARRIRVIQPADYSRLLLSEVFYDPLDSETDKEFVEIWNAGPDACDISGFRIVDGSPSSQAFVFPQGSVIAPWGRIVVAQSDSVFFLLFGFHPDFYPFQFLLNNSGESVFLLHPDGTARDAVYIEGGSKEIPVPPGWGSATLPAALEGQAIHRRAFPDYDSWEDWEALTPSPGV